MIRNDKMDEKNYSRSADRLQNSRLRANQFRYGHKRLIRMIAKDTYFFKRFH